MKHLVDRSSFLILIAGQPKASQPDLLYKFSNSPPNLLSPLPAGQALERGFGASA